MGIYARVVLWLIRPALKISEKRVCGIQISDAAAVAKRGDTIILSASRRLRREEREGIRIELDRANEKFGVTFLLLEDPLGVAELKKFDCQSCDG